MIRFICPGCQKTLSAPDGSEGGRVTCPSCQQRLVVPGPAGDPDEQLPDLELVDDRPPEPERPSRALSQRGKARDEDEAPDADADERPSRRPARSRAEDEDDDRPSRRRRKDEDEADDVDDRPSRRRRRRGGEECPFCGSSERPIRREEISQAGWIVFVVMILFCWPLCFIGLFMKEAKLTCADCGRKIGP